MSDSAPNSFLRTLRWLSSYAGLPGSRLPDKAELLVLIAAAAAEAEEPASGNPHHRKIMGNQNFSAQIRNYTAQRRRAHLTSDNSAKT